MDLFDRYLSYTDQSEPPKIYHRWSLMTGIAAILGRNLWMEHGHFRIFPNIYTMLIGGSGTRKSAAVKLSRRLIAASGYETFAADKTSKEKFLMAMAGIGNDFDDDTKLDGITSQNLWGKDDREPKEVYIVADEFNEFAGAGNIDFYSLLGSLWDWDDPITDYRNEYKNSKQVYIYQPTINILGGNTPENFARAFPPEIIGQGFLSRLLLIHGVRSGKRFAFPPSPSPEETTAIISILSRIKIEVAGMATMDEETRSLLATIYECWEDIDDIRFKSYSTRRFTQLLKICLIIAASRFSSIISTDIVIYANTILHAAETNFPVALGEFGKNRDSDVRNKIIDVLEKAHAPVSAKELWKHVHKDLSRATDLNEITSSLAAADRIQLVSLPTGQGYLMKKKLKKTPQYVDLSLLTPEERDML